MISKTKLKKRIGKKSDSEIVETLILAKKHDAWIGVAQKLSGARREYSSVNLKQIEGLAKSGDVVVVIGRVLGLGELKKKVKICALGFSGSALEKIRKTGAEGVLIKEEIKKNPKASGIKIFGGKL